MIAPSRSLLRRLKRATRRVVRDDAELRRLRRSARRAARRRIVFSTLRVFVPLVVLGAAATLPSAAEVVPGLALWTLANTLFRAAQIIGTLYGDGIWIYFLLPVANDEVFRTQRRLVLRSAVWVGLDWLAFGIVAAARHGGAAGWFAAPLFALGQIVVSLVVAALLARAAPRFPFAPASSLVAASIFFVLQLANSGTAFAPVAQLILKFVSLSTPAGWLGGMEIQAIAAEWAGWLSGTALIAGAGWVLVTLMRRAQARYSLERFLGYEDTDEAGSRFVPPATAVPARSAHEDAGAIETPTTGAPRPIDEAHVRGRLEDLLTAPPGLALFRRGWLEARLVRRLSVRQRVLLDFLQPQGVSWGWLWLTGLGLIVMTGAVRHAGYNGGWLPWLPVIALLITAVPLFGGRWIGLQGVLISNGLVGVHAFAPIGFRDIAVTIMTARLLRTIAALPLVMLAVRYGFTATPLPWPETLGLVVRIAVLAVALLPVPVISALSPATNDTSSRAWLTAALITTAVLGILVGISLGIAITAVDRIGVVIGCSALLLTLSFASLAFYGWAWNRGLFDLIGKPPQMR